MSFANMRIVILLALTACAETDDDPLPELTANTKKRCGSSNIMGCYADAATVASCMNDALASGTRAEADELSADRYGSFVRRYVFAVDNQFTVYDVHPTADSATDPYTHTIATCPGPVRVGSQCPGGDTLVVDGCN